MASTDPNVLTERTLTRDEAKTRAALITGCSYAVALDLTGEGDSFLSETTLTFGCTKPGASTFIEITAAKVHRIDLNGRTLPASAFQGTRIQLDDLQAENTLTVEADCVFGHTGNGLHRFADPVDGNVYLYSDFEPREAHRVYACFDQPDIKGTFDFSVKAPAGWVVASNKPAIERPEADQAGRWRFVTTDIMPTYITAIVAGPWHEVRDQHGDISLGILCRRSLAEFLDPDEIFTVTKQGFDFFTELFDMAYPFGPKYDQVFVPEFNSGAMENAGCVTFNELYIFRSKVTDASRESRAQTILHEMAHMWFGDLVTMRWWDDLWLNESFATYMGHLSQERGTRFTQSWTTFAKKMKTWAYAQDQLPTTHPIVADIPDTESARTHFDGISYAKGASVLKQLVAWVGEEAFIKGVRAYFRDHAHGNATLAEFLGSLEEASGRDLTAWSAEWLETAGVNTIRATSETDGDLYRSLVLEQSAPEAWPTLRSHRIALGLYDLQGEQLVLRRSLELDAVGARTEVTALAGEPIPDLLLLNDQDLAYSKIRLDERSLATATEHLAALDDQLARSLIWGAAWDQVRDAEMRARDFVEQVLRNVGAEGDIGIVQSLLTQAQIAIVRYGDPANRESARARFATAAREATEAAEPGSDLQLAWARSFFGAARSDADVTLLEQLLDGDADIPGLAIDTDLRWGIVQRLAVLGRAGGRIETELKRDPTDQGQRNAATARTAQPSADAKGDSWSSIVEDPSLPLAMMRAMIGGFWIVDQAELLAPYRDRFFEALAPMWDQRDPEVALTFATAMYPFSQLDDELLAVTDAHLERGDVPPALRRPLIEGRDEAARALRARERDAKT